MDEEPLAPIDSFLPLEEEPRWPEHWWYLRDEPALRQGVQRELHAELSRPRRRGSLTEGRQANFPSVNCAPSSLAVQR